MLTRFGTATARRRRTSHRATSDVQRATCNVRRARRATCARANVLRATCHVQRATCARCNLPRVRRGDVGSDLRKEGTMAETLDGVAAKIDALAKGTDI